MLYCVVNYWAIDYAEGEGNFNLQNTLQNADGKTIVELFELELNYPQHGPFTSAFGTDIDGIQAGGNEDQTFTYYFTNTTNELGNDVVWQGKTYRALPIKAEGYEATGKGTLPRPTLSVGNLGGTITNLIALLPDGLEGCKVTRTRTLSKFLDAVNFSGVGTYVEANYWMPEYNLATGLASDPTSFFKPRDIYFVDRKSIENREVISYELCSAFDLVGVRLPKRQILPDEFPGVGTFSY